MPFRLTSNWLHGEPSMKSIRSIGMVAIVLVMTTGIIYADPVITGPTKSDPYKIIDLSITGTGNEDLVFWDLTEEMVADIREKGNALSFTAPPGMYHIKARIIPVKDGKITGTGVVLRTSVCIVTPIPPTPPTPPVPPAPMDPLTGLFQAGYTKDIDTDRAKSLAFLKGAYQGMAAQVVSRSDLKTNSDFVTWMKSVVEAPGVGLTATQIKGLRMAIGNELALSWGTTLAPLSPAAAAIELQKISNALNGVQ